MKNPPWIIYVNKDVSDRTKILKLPTSWSDHKVQIVTIPEEDTCKVMQKKSG